MEFNLNQFELAIMNGIAKSNEKEHSFVRDHIPYLRVKSRRKTGVGMYVDFFYTPEGDSLEFDKNGEMVISSPKGLALEGLKYNLNYELNISNGRIDFLELVTNGESWDGEVGNFRFVE
jgi:hypothetical protein